MKPCLVVDNSFFRNLEFRHLSSGHGITMHNLTAMTSSQTLLNQLPLEYKYAYMFFGPYRPSCIKTARKLYWK